MTIYTPYTYLIGWTKLDKYYYGVEYGSITKTANPENLWTTYFTSSERVSAFRETYGEPDIVQVRKIFNCGTQEERKRSAVLHEERVLRRIRAHISERYLNACVGGAIVLDEIARGKISAGNKGKKRTHRQKEVIKARMKSNNPFKGRKHTTETKAIQSLLKRGEKHPNWGKHHTAATKQKMSIASLGKCKSDEHKRAISLSHNKTYTCPHCQKSGGRLMLRWHFDHCRNKLQTLSEI